MKYLPAAQILQIYDIVDGYILRRDNKIAAIAEVVNGPGVFTADNETINVLANTFQNVLDNLKENEIIQIISISKRLKPDGIIEEYNSKITSPDEDLNSTYPELQKNWLADLIIKHNIPEYKYYVVYTYECDKKNTGDITKLKEDIGFKFAIILDGLARCGLETKEMNTWEVKEVLNEFMNPEAGRISDKLFENAPTATVDDYNRMTKTEILSRTAFYFAYDYFRHGRYFGKTIYITDLLDPEGVNFFLKKLCLNNNYFRVSLFCHGVKQDIVYQNLQKQRKRSHASSFTGVLGDMRSQEIYNKTDEILRAYTQGNIKFVRFSLYITFYSDTLDNLYMLSDSICSLFSELPVIKGEYEQEALFRSTLPLAINLLNPTLTTSFDLANAYPFLFNKLGTSDGIIEGISANREIVKINPWHSDLVNANQSVLGQAGSGKSFYTNLFLFKLLPWNPEVMIIDRSKSYEILCKVAKGQYIYYDLNSGKYINPFDLGEDDRINNEISPDKIDFLMGLLDIILAEEGEISLDKLNKSIIQEALINTYLYKKNDTPALSDLADVLLAMSNQEVHKEWKMELKTLNKKLQMYVKNGTYGPLVDRKTNVDIQSAFVVFDTSNLRQDDHLQSLATYIISNFLLDRIIKNKKNSKKQVLAIDEAWSMVRFPAGANFLMNLSKRSRHLGLACVFCTQQITDFLNNDSAVNVLKNSPTITLFKQSTADINLIAQTLNLNEQEKSILLSLGQRRYQYSQALQIIGNTKGIVNIIPDPLLYWIATTEPNRDVPLRENTIKDNNGDIWAALWNLAERSV